MKHIKIVIEANITDSAATYADRFGEQLLRETIQFSIDNRAEVAHFTSEGLSAPIAYHMDRQTEKKPA